MCLVQGLVGARQHRERVFAPGAPELGQTCRDGHAFESRRCDSSDGRAEPGEQRLPVDPRRAGHHDRETRDRVPAGESLASRYVPETSDDLPDDVLERRRTDCGLQRGAPGHLEEHQGERP